MTPAYSNVLLAARRVLKVAKESTEPVPRDLAVAIRVLERAVLGMPDKPPQEETPWRCEKILLPTGVIIDLSYAEVVDSSDPTKPEKAADGFKRPGTTLRALPESPTE